MCDTFIDLWHRGDIEVRHSAQDIRPCFHLQQAFLYCPDLHEHICIIFLMIYIYRDISLRSIGLVTNVARILYSSMQVKRIQIQSLLIYFCRMDNALCWRQKGHFDQLHPLHCYLVWTWKLGLVSSEERRYQKNPENLFWIPKIRGNQHSREICRNSYFNCGIAQSSTVRCIRHVYRNAQQSRRLYMKKKKWMEEALPGTVCQNFCLL